MRRPAATLQNWDGSFNRKITPTEGEDLERQGNAEFVGRAKTTSAKKRKKRNKFIAPPALIWKLIQHPIPLRSIDQASPPSITRADIHANVGITPGLGEADPKRIRRAQRKIRLFEPSYLGSSPENLIQDFDRAAVELYSNARSRPSVMWMSLGVAAELGVDVSSAPANSIVRLTQEGATFEVVPARKAAAHGHQK